MFLCTEYADSVWLIPCTPCIQWQSDALVESVGRTHRDKTSSGLSLIECADNPPYRRSIRPAARVPPCAGISADPSASTSRRDVSGTRGPSRSRRPFRRPRPPTSPSVRAHPGACRPAIPIPGRTRASSQKSAPAVRRLRPLRARVRVRSLPARAPRRCAFGERRC